MNNNIDVDREYLIQLLFSLCDYARLGYEVINKVGNCGDCMNKECEYKPNPGEYLRFNCPFWED